MSSVPAPLRPFIDAWLESCLTSGLPPLVKDVARELGVSTHTVSSTFYAQEGLHLSSYINLARMARAKSLLQSTDLPIAQLARRAGYAHERPFYRAFKRQTGTTPGEFRRAHRKIE